MQLFDSWPWILSVYISQTTLIGWTGLACFEQVFHFNTPSSFLTSLHCCGNTLILLHLSILPQTRAVWLWRHTIYIHSVRVASHWEDFLSKTQLLLIQYQIRRRQLYHHVGSKESGLFEYVWFFFEFGFDCSTWWHVEALLQRWHDDMHGLWDYECKQSAWF